MIQNKESALVELSNENFQENVIDSEDVWLVQFTAGQWCPPCMALKGTFRKTSYRLKEFVRFGSSINSYRKRIVILRRRL